jgi:hypothetical protein
VPTGREILAGHLKKWSAGVAQLRLLDSDTDNK